MNGMKLGSKHLPNSHQEDFSNEFIDYHIPDQSHHSDTSQQLSMEQQKQKKSVVKDKQKKKLRKLNNDISNLSVSIKNLREKYNEMDFDEIMFRKRSPKKQAEVKKFIAKQSKQRKRRDHRMSRILQKKEEKLQESIKMDEENEKNKIKKRVDDELKGLIKKKQEKEVERQKQLQKQKEIDKMYEKIQMQEKKKKKFYLRKEDEDRRKNKRKKKRDEEFLLKRRQIYKPLNFNEFEDHYKKHQQKLDLLQLEKNEKREKKYLQILEGNNRFDNLYRGPSYDRVQLQEQVKKQKKQLPQQRYKRMKNYRQYVREHFAPKSHQKSAQHSVQLEGIKENRSLMSHRQVKRFKYIKGYAYGQVIENMRIGKSEQQIKDMGNKNFGFMKNLPKKKKSKEDDESPYDLQKLDHKLNELANKKNNQVPKFSKGRKQNFDVNVSEKPTRAEVNMLFDQLNNFDEKAKRKQFLLQSEENNEQYFNPQYNDLNDDIANNIERKLNLLGKLAV